MLTVVGGVGLPFVAEAPKVNDDIWRWDIRHLDATAYLSEADIWAARANFEADSLQLSGKHISGVVPLAVCGELAQRDYETQLAPIALMQLGAQLRNTVPTSPWGWEESTIFSLQEALAARETAALRCACRDLVQPGCTKAQASLAISLVTQLSCRLKDNKNSRWPALESAAALLKGEAAGDENVIQVLPAIAVAVSGANLSKVAARLVYFHDVKLAAYNAGIGSNGASLDEVASRYDKIVEILALNPSSQHCIVTEDQVLKSLASRLQSCDGDDSEDDEKNNEENLGNDEVSKGQLKNSLDTSLASPTVIAKRISEEVTWMPAPDLVKGLVHLFSQKEGGVSSLISAKHPTTSGVFFCRTSPFKVRLRYWCAVCRCSSRRHFQLWTYLEQRRN